MTLQEFIDRTGFTPTEGHFRAIHGEYMAAGVGKDAFCAGWLEGGGPQRAYDWMRDRYNEARCDLASVTEDNRALAAGAGDIQMYRRALHIARLMLESLRDCADGEDMTMALDEIGGALANGMKANG